jgi:hypothetical protein
MASGSAVRPIRAARTRVELAASFIVLGVELCSFGRRAAAMHGLICRKKPVLPAR